MITALLGRARAHFMVASTCAASSGIPGAQLLFVLRSSLVLSCHLVCGRCKWIAADGGCLSHAMDAAVFCMVATRIGGHVDGTLTDMVCRMQGYDHGSVGSIPWSVYCGVNLSG